MLMNILIGMWLIWFLASIIGAGIVDRIDPTSRLANKLLLSFTAAAITGSCILIGVFLAVLLGAKRFC
jgi:hypothetical protein